MLFSACGAKRLSGGCARLPLSSLPYTGVSWIACPTSYESAFCIPRGQGTGTTETQTTMATPTSYARDKVTQRAVHELGSILQPQQATSAARYRHAACFFPFFFSFFFSPTAARRPTTKTRTTLGAGFVFGCAR